MTEILLADRLIEAAQSYPGPKRFKGDLTYAAAKIKSAQRFVVSDDVRGSIRSLLTSRPSTIFAASRFARLPFERCWFEWIVPKEQNIRPGQLPVKRCGAFLETIGHAAFSCWTAWQFEEEPLVADVLARAPDMLDLLDLVPRFGVSAVVGAYDFADMTEPTIMSKDPNVWRLPRVPTASEAEGMRNDKTNSLKWALHDPKEWEALIALAERSAFRVHDEVNGMDNIVEQGLTLGSADSILHDVEDEMGHLFATLILMNSKNCVEIAKTEPPVQLNKARSKRGKPELLPYSTVKIELSQGQMRAVASGLISREEARRHLVRGHFKVRATGVFWWGDFIRGSAARGTIERRAHIVEA